jgi:hypothetical protein
MEKIDPPGLSVGGIFSALAVQRRLIRANPSEVDKRIAVVPVGGYR